MNTCPGAARSALSGGGGVGGAVVLGATGVLGGGASGVAVLAGPVRWSPSHMSRCRASAAPSNLPHTSRSSASSSNPPAKASMTCSRSSLSRRRRRPNGRRPAGDGDRAHTYSAKCSNTSASDTSGPCEPDRTCRAWRAAARASSALVTGVRVRAGAGGQKSLADQPLRVTGSDSRSASSRYAAGWGRRPPPCGADAGSPPTAVELTRDGSAAHQALRRAAPPQWPSALGHPHRRGPSPATQATWRASSTWVSPAANRASRTRSLPQPTSPELPRV